MPIDAVVSILLSILFFSSLGMENFLIFAKRTDIRKISLDVDYYADVVIPLGDVRNAIAVDVDNVEGE